MKLLAIFGTRPEAIKMAPIIQLAKQDLYFNVEVCVTAQHREMLDQMLELFEIKPNYDLNIMSNGQDLFDITARALMGLKNILLQSKPDYILVQGDTTTTFVGALSAFYLSIPVGHVEAGLRTGNLKAPFPEEANRVLTSHLVNHHFAPTDGAKNNLIAEGIDESNIIVTGNTVIDALLYMQNRVKTKRDWGDVFGFAQTAIFSDKPLILVTGHRRESFGEGFQVICCALSKLAEKHPDWSIVYPVHLNPNVQKPANELLSKHRNIYLISPLSYEPFVYLMDRATLILTDSGGIQEEAPSFSKPVLVMREQTERPECVEAGAAILVGTDVNRIVNEAENLLSDSSRYSRMASVKNPFGDGKAASRILSEIKQRFI